MINSIKSFKFQIHYYKLDYNLSPNIEHLRELLAKNSILLVVNYFGVEANWSSINNLKKEFQLITIEDNCHSLMTSSGVGSFGDYSFNSLRKILPLLSGSQLQYNKKIFLEKNTILKNIRYPDFNELKYFLRLYKLKSFKKIKKQKQEKISEIIYKTKEIDILSHRILINNNFNIDKIISMRTNNYKYWESFLETDNFNFFNIKTKDIYCPYVFPCIAKSKKIMTLWIDWGIANNISIINWPKTPFENHDHFGNNDLNNVLLFPVNHQFNLSI